VRRYVEEEICVQVYDQRMFLQAVQRADIGLGEVGLYKSNPVNKSVKAAWFQRLNLSSEILVSNFAFKFSLCRYSESYMNGDFDCDLYALMDMLCSVGLFKLKSVDP
jgi:hypothetical protein